MIRNFRKTMTGLTILVNLLDDTFPTEMTVLSNLYYKHEFTREDGEKLKIFIDKLIAVTEKVEVYEISAELLKIKNMI